MAAARRAMNGVKPTFDNLTRAPCWARCALEVANLVEPLLELAANLARIVCATPAANGVAEISVAKTWQNLQAEVVNVEGNRLPVSFEKSVSRQVGAFTATAEKGFYEVDVPRHLMPGLYRWGTARVFRKETSG